MPATFWLTSIATPPPVVHRVVDWKPGSAITPAHSQAPFCSA
ncbi:MAG TPA: hypothetical protein VFQ53_30045 [Kofleriaceae bacterium]|nr:hypothetical protein [Kofleriaceae bacterium]